MLRGHETALAGVRPVLFRLGDIAVPSYGFFVLLGIAAGIWVYAREAKRDRAGAKNALTIFVAALVGGTVGAKLPSWVCHFREIIAALTTDPFNAGVVLSGRTVLGGMIGGVAAVWIIKRILRIKEKKGNLFAPALALGLVIGRIGCFLGGCCYGVATGSSWGIDFGDGIPRHPTQLYESVFALLLFVWLMRALRRNPAPGILFRYFIRSYFLFRFFISFIRAETAPVFWGLSDVQWVSIVVIVLSLREAILNRFVKLRKVVVYG